VADVVIQIFSKAILSEAKTNGGRGAPRKAFSLVALPVLN